MTRKEKLEAIYKEMADKELTFGCKLQTELGRTVSIVEETTDELGYIVVSPESLYGDNDVGAFYCGIRVRGLEAIEPIDIAEIIGHPVMLGTIFERYSASKGFINSQFILALVDKWTGYDRSIEEQSDECIDYIYSLIQKS